MGAAVRERRIQLVNDVLADPRYVKPPAAVDVRAELAVPIVLGEHVLGVLNVESDRPFDQEDATSLQIIADHLAVAIRNARLFESASALAVLEERERLSRDLHDSVTQMLFSVTLVAQSLIPTWRQDPKEGEARADRVLQLSRLALAEMRALIADLRLDVPIHDSLQGAAPVGLSRVRREGLPAALRGYAEEIGGGAFEVALELEGYRPQPFEREEALFRIGQEALNNVVKHAGASRVTIGLRQDRDGIHLTVADDGRGFEEIAAEPVAAAAGGLGLVGMRERTRAQKGELRIESVPGRGHAGQGHDAGGGGSMSAAIRVLIVDDHQIVREGLRTVLEQEASVEVVGEAADGLAAVVAADKLRPDVVLMDLSMPGIDGIEALGRIRDGAPGDPGGGAHELRDRPEGEGRGGGGRRRLPAEGRAEDRAGAGDPQRARRAARRCTPRRSVISCATSPRRRRRCPARS